VRVYDLADDVRVWDGQTSYSIRLSHREQSARHVQMAQSRLSPKTTAKMAPELPLVQGPHRLLLTGKIRQIQIRRMGGGTAACAGCGSTRLRTSDRIRCTRDEECSRAWRSRGPAGS